MESKKKLAYGQIKKCAYGQIKKYIVLELYLIALFGVPLFAIIGTIVGVLSPGVCAFFILLPYFIAAVVDAKESER